MLVVAVLIWGCFIVGGSCVDSGICGECVDWVSVLLMVFDMLLILVVAEVMVLGVAILVLDKDGWGHYENNYI